MEARTLAIRRSLTACIPWMAVVSCVGHESAATDAGGGTSGTIDAASWGCLDHPVLPVEREPQDVTFIVPVLDFDGKPTVPLPIPGMTLMVCASPACSSAAGVSFRADDTRPYLEILDFPFGLDNGPIRYEAPDHVPVDYFLGGPMIGAPEGGYAVAGLALPMLRNTRRDSIYSQLGLPDSDPARGMLIVRTLDCSRDPGWGPRFGARASGVAVEIKPSPDAEAVPFTLSTQNNVARNRLITDSRGEAGWANISPGAYVVHGVAPVGGSEGTSYGDAMIQVRAGVVTIAEVRDGIDRWGQ